MRDIGVEFAAELEAEIPADKVGCGCLYAVCGRVLDGQMEREPIGGQIQL